MKKISFISTTTDRLGSHRYRISTPIQLLRSQSGLSVSLQEYPNGDEDVAIFSKHFNFLDYQYARYVHAKGGKVIMDICDNHTLDPRFGSHYIRMAKEADAITYSTRELLLEVEPIFDNNDVNSKLFVVGDPPIFTKGKPKHFVPKSNPNMLWYGQSPSLQALQPHLPYLPTGNLVVICDRFPDWLSTYRGHIVPIEWSEGDFVRYVTECDIVLLPQELDAKSRCKSNNRLTEAVNLGRPVAASPIPAYLEFSDTMFIGDSIDEQVERFMKCHVSDIHSRIETAQQLIDSKYSANVVLSQWLRAINSLYS